MNIVVHFHVADQSVGFEQERGHLYFRRLVCAEVFQQPVHGVAGVHDILNHNNGAPLYVFVQAEHYRQTEQLDAKITGTFDYGINAGIGFEFYLRPSRKVMVPAVPVLHFCFTEGEKETRLMAPPVRQTDGGKRALARSAGL